MKTQLHLAYSPICYWSKNIWNTFKLHIKRSESNDMKTNHLALMHRLLPLPGADICIHRKICCINTNSPRILVSVSFHYSRTVKLVEWQSWHLIFSVLIKNWCCIFVELQYTFHKFHRKPCTLGCEKFMRVLVHKQK